MNNSQIQISRPDDMHLHLRDGIILQSVVSYSSQNFGRAIVMPNLVPPITCTAMAKIYRNQILAAIPAGDLFEPLMTLYLTDSTTKHELRLGVEEGIFSAVKLYPAGATTNSELGVTKIEKVFSILETMVELDLPLLLHGEVVDSHVDIFDREKVFIDSILLPLRKNFPELRLVLEHVTTSDGVNYVKESNTNLFATITPHHLVLNRNDIFKGGINPHNYCLPILKRESHRLTLLDAATSGDTRFFLGTDSAPHTLDFKENSCGCAGVFNAPNTLGVLASVFEEKGALDNLEGFTSINGCKFYNLQVSSKKITLVKGDTPVSYPNFINTPKGKIKLFKPEFDVFWYVKDTPKILTQVKKEL